MKPRSARMMTYKTVLIGDGAVGKTSIRRSYMGTEFISSHLATIGVDFAQKQIQTEDAVVRFVVWDLAGQPSFERVRRHYYQGSHSLILVYSVIDRETFDNASKWLVEAYKYMGQLPPTAVIGNKIFEVEYRLKCKNGDIRYFIERGKPIYGREGPLYIDGVILDITERKLAEEALCESEEKLAGILASVADYISMIDRQHNIVWVNDVGKKLFGENIVGRKCYNVYHRYNKPCEKCAVLKSFEDGNIHEHEIEAITADGNQKTFWTTASVVKRDKNGRPVLVVEVSRDITSRKKAEKELNDELEQQVKARTSELLKSTLELQSRQEELLGHKLELEKVNKELLDTNNAISVLARNIDKNKEEAEKKIALTINSNIMPIIANLKDYKMLKKHRSELDVLTAYLNDISTSLSNDTDIIVRLSTSEMRVAAMIKNGITSKEIATKLNISLDTVKTHRKNIRKKLKIHNSDINLANYLRQKWGKG